MMVTLAFLASPLGNLRHLRRSLLTALLSAAALLGLSSACAQGPSSTTLTASSSAVTSGTAVTLTATVHAGGGLLYNGQVAFCDAAAAHCTDIHRLFVAPFISGNAIYKFIPGPGSHAYKAVFLGINPYAGSTSSTVGVSVTPLRPTLTSIAQGGSVGSYSEFSVVSAAGTSPPTGTVSYLDTSNSNYVLGTGSLVPAAPSLHFTNSQTPGTASGPTSVASGDFDGDGKLDLAIVNYSNNSVTILLGGGDGTFTYHAILAGFTQPVAIVSADFNNDGVLDLAVANSGSSSVWVMFGTGTGNFGSVHATSVSNNPSALAVADFNDDGTPDLVVTSVGSGSVDILTGDGYGAFSLTGLHATGNNPTSVAVADFNNDGKQDMVVTNHNDSTVTVLLGNGSGNVSSAVTLGAFGQSYSVVTADFNGDGNQDFAVADFLTSSATIFLGKGDGTFTTAPAGTSSYPVALAVADVNGDGIPDLIAVNDNSPAGSVSVLLGNGDGTFQGYLSAALGDDPRSIAVGDFNGDGVTDLVAPNYSGANATVLLAQPTQAATVTVTGLSPVGTGTHQIVASYPGDANFAPSISGSSGLTAQRVATTLVLTVNPASSVAGHTVTLMASLSPAAAQNHSTDGQTITFTTHNGSSFLGTATLTAGIATFNASSLPVGVSTLGATFAGDVNFRNAASNTISYTVATTTSTALAITSAGAAVTSVPAATPVTLTATVLSGSAPVSRGLVAFCDAAAPNCTDVHRVGTAQLTSAGNATLVVIPAIGSHSYKAVFLGTTASAASSSTASTLTVTGLFPTATTLTSSGSPGNYTLAASVVSLTHSPLSGTVAFTDTTNGNASLGSASIPGSSSTFALGAAQTFATGAQPKAVATADFNGDGKPDLVIANYGASTLTVELGNGDGTFTPAPTVTGSNLSNPNAIAVGDFNGDGKQDLAVANYGNGAIVIFLGNGDGTFGSGASVGGTGLLLPVALVVADFNSDGFADIAVADAYTDHVTVLLGDGHGNFTTGPLLGAGNYPAAIVAADFNNDGFADIAVANVIDRTITVFFGAGNGQFPTSRILPNVGSSYALATADLDADGNADLIALDSGGNTVTVLRGDGTGSFAALLSPITATNPIVVAVGDLNGDGIPDLVTANNSVSSTLDVFFGNGDGTFQAAIFYAGGNNPQALVLADFNGDGSADPVTANFNSNNASVLLAQTTQTAIVSANGISPTGPGTSHAAQANYSGDTAHAGSASNLVFLSPLPYAGTPAFSPVAGTYTSAQTVTLTTLMTGETIFYTTDGSAPTTSSAQYLSPISVTASETITAIATAPNYQTSPAVAATYTINYPPTITTQPTASQTITSGNTASLSVTATSATPLTYQWYSGASPNTGNPIPGATSSTYTTSTLTATYPPVATFNYWVQVNNASAVPANSNTASITVNAIPVAAAPTFSPPAGTYTSAQIVTLSSNTPTPYFGIYYTTDGSAPTTASRQYTGPLSVTASETIRAFTAASGYQNSPVSSATYTIASPPAITNPPASQTVNSGSAVTLTVSASGTAPLSYQWSSGLTASSLTPISGATAASYNTGSLTATTYFQVQVNNASANPATASATITVIQAPTCTLAVQPTSTALAVTASSHCTDQQGQSLTQTIAWGDGTSSPATGTISHTYAVPGTYTVILSAIDTSGLTGTATQLISPNQSPTCTLAVSATSTALAVTATPHCTDPQGQSLTQTITWGDGTSSPATGTTSHTYAASGTYTVILSATDTSGLTATATQLITPNRSPVCTLSVQATSTALTGVATSHCADPQSQALTEIIAWGDGSSSPVNLATNTNTHAYTAAKTYNVTLSATNASGLTGTATQPFSPNQSPICTLGVVQGQISTAVPTVYPVTVSGGCTGSPSLSLDWGDGTGATPITGPPPYAHTYPGSTVNTPSGCVTGSPGCVTTAVPATYNVVLTGIDASGLKGSSAPQPVQIVPAQSIPAGGSTPVSSTIPPPPTLPPAPVQVTFLCSSVSVMVKKQIVTTIPSAYGISCTSPPVQLTSAPVPVNVTITTSNGAVAAMRTPAHASSPLALCGIAFPFLGLAFLLPLAPARRRRFTALALACMACLSLSACGGYFQAPATAATPAGLYYVTLVETVVNAPAPTGFVQTSLIVPLPVTH